MIAKLDILHILCRLHVLIIYPHPIHLRSRLMSHISLNLYTSVSSLHLTSHMLNPSAIYTVYAIYHPTLPNGGNKITITQNLIENGRGVTKY